MGARWKLSQPLHSLVTSRQFPGSTCPLCSYFFELLTQAHALNPSSFDKPWKGIPWANEAQPGQLSSNSKTNLDHMFQLVGDDMQAPV